MAWTSKVANIIKGKVASAVAGAISNKIANSFADQGQTRAIQNAEVGISEPNNKMFLFKPGIDLKEIVDAVNETGATPSSLIAILEALKSSGSLRAELVVI